MLPELAALLITSPIVILQAPPGSGKTTRVPLHLLDEPFLTGQSIVMLEPRRLAATNAARWMARLCGEETGGTVGYSIRFDRKVSARTRLEIVTEGILTRRLQHDSDLSGIGLVIFDEFHERSLHADLALALCRDIQTGLRPDIRILIMSATLDTESLSARLGGAPVVSSSGRCFPVEIRHESDAPERPLFESVAWGVMTALRENSGDILAFLPGSGDIIRCGRLLESLLPSADAPLVVPLYGDLPFERQELAIAPAERRKVVLATNIAETSLTIENVRVVVDSGWCRQMRFSPATGLNRLVTGRISLASAEQRAGRAGREAPGVCYRLWPLHVHHGLVASPPPEIAVADLSQMLLELLAWGVADPSQLQWIDSPPAAATAEARSLLQLLGAADDAGKVTALGRRMAETGLHPRLGRILAEAETVGMAAVGADLVAILSERDMLRFERGILSATRLSDSDPMDRLELLHSLRRGSHDQGAQSVDRGAFAAVERAAQHLRRHLHVERSTTPPTFSLIGRLCAVAWPERVALRRTDGDTYLLASGTGACLASATAVRTSPLLVALDVEAGKGPDAGICMATTLDIDDLRQIFPDRISKERSVAWDQKAGRVTGRIEEFFGALVLSSRYVKPEPAESAAALLTGVRMAGGSASLPWSDGAHRFLARVRFLAALCPEEGWPELSFPALDKDLEQWLAPAIEGVMTLDALAKTDLEQAVRRLLSRHQLHQLQQGAPESLPVPSGRRVPLQYMDDGPPILAVKLQEMFGCARTPMVAFGRVPVVIHLLSPAGRPLQVTSDLAGFWDRVYPEVKKEMKGRYPRHPWPDDPWQAPPTCGTSKGSRR